MPAFYTALGVVGAFIIGLFWLFNTVNHIVIIIILIFGIPAALWLGRLINEVKR